MEAGRPRPAPGAWLAGAAFSVLLAACSTPAPIVQSPPVVLPPPPAAEPPPPPPPKAEAPAPKPPPIRPLNRRGSGKFFRDDGPGDRPAAQLVGVPDAVPRREAVSVSANQPYNVFGRRYVPMTRLAPFRQRGVASWYGRKFHGRPTATGETYDMYAMTAAHPTLPLPCFVRVTHVANGRSVIVRVNDRGPFLNGRAIDLSYTAAVKLGYSPLGSAGGDLGGGMGGDFPDSAPTPAASPPPPRSTAVKGLMLTSDLSKARWLPVASFDSSVSAAAAVPHLERELELPRGSLALGFDGRHFQLQLGPYANAGQVEAARRALQSRIDDDDGTGSE